MNTKPLSNIFVLGITITITISSTNTTTSAITLFIIAKIVQYMLSHMYVNLNYDYH